MANSNIFWLKSKANKKNIIKFLRRVEAREIIGKEQGGSMFPTTYIKKCKKAQEELQYLGSTEKLKDLQ